MPTRELQRIRVREYFLAYGIPGLTAEPSQADLDALLAATEMFWFTYFQNFYANMPDIQFIGLNLNPELVLFNPMIPNEPTLNYYIDFDTVILYELDSAEPPDAAETFGIMANADFEDYILNFVQPINAFVSCDEVLFEAQEFFVPAVKGLDHGNQTRRGLSTGSLSQLDGSRLPVHIRVV